MTLSPLRLKSQEDRRLKAGHLWVYSNEINVTATPLAQFSPGQLVLVESAQGNPLGIAYINPHALLCARLLTRDSSQAIDTEFFVNRLLRALHLREQLFAKPFYRLVFGEADLLPGLVIDRYADVLVVQITSAGMEQLKDFIVSALEIVLAPKTILFRNDSSMRRLENLGNYTDLVLGEVADVVELEENGIKFFAPIKEGQKTGWFYDHRYNRERLRNYVKDKRVLDLFSYVGGWGIQAAMFGAKEVCCVDSSQFAIDYVNKNSELNKVNNIVHARVADVFEELKKLRQTKEKFDVIVLDPPAFIKKRKDIKSGVLAYQRINELAMQVLNKDGFLITSSCSLHLSQETLVDAVRRAAINLGRDCQILEQRGQAADHPIHPAIPETTYLKALFCRVS